MANEPKRGWWHDVGLLVVGAILTTVTGSVIANSYQAAAWHRQRDADDLIEERKRAMAVINEISTHLGALHRAAGVCGGPEKQERAAGCQSLRKEQDTWEDVAMRLRGEVRLAFGEPASINFSAVSAALMRDYDVLRKTGLDDKLEGFDTAPSRADRLFEELLGAVQEGKVGRFGNQEPKGQSAGGELPQSD